MMTALAILVGGILFLLSGVHLYWLAGGQEGHLQRYRAMVRICCFDLPKRLQELWRELWPWQDGSCFGEVIERLLFPEWLFTVFAKWDTVLYNPLCLFIGGSLLFITGTVTGVLR